jgi:hypothetical protein
MQSYPPDIDPQQRVRWVKTEYAAAPSTFEREVREIPPRRETHLGDQEREDLTETATIWLSQRCQPISAREASH